MHTYILDPQTWAQHTFAGVELGDERRTRRAVHMGARMMRHPGAHLPQQMGAPKATKAAYRLLDEEEVTYQALSQPHWQHTLRAAADPDPNQPVVLFVHDDTHVDHTHHPRSTRLGPIGDGSGQGYIVHSVLALTPKMPHPRQVLGIAHQQPYLRQPAADKTENSIQRRKRQRESLAWLHAVEQVGRPPDPEHMMWVHVGDRYADIFDFMSAAVHEGCHFLVRAAQDRRIRTCEGELDKVLSLAAHMPAQDYQTIHLPPLPALPAVPAVPASPARAHVHQPAQPAQPARQARLALSVQHVSLLAPKHSLPKPTHYQEQLSVWVIRIWEPDPPPEVQDQDPLEWVLLTSVPTDTVAQGWERRDWYSMRWLIEEYHHCLKTGCLLEERHLHTGDRLMRLLGFLSPVAVQLLQLRELARTAPEELATHVLPMELVAVVAALADVPLDTLTVQGLWRQVAQQGGYLGRKGDGPPGWQTLWRGWMHVQSVLEGVRLAHRLALPPQPPPPPRPPDTG